MTKLTLADYVEMQRDHRVLEHRKVGPFLTISRQYGCWGFSLALLVADILNEDPANKQPWQVYGKEILCKLATETNLAAELLDRERKAQPRLLVDFFRCLSGKRIPSGFEIRNRVTAIIRGVAIEGHAIILGQGGAGATQDLANGLSIRLEAPTEWRLEQVMFREGVTEVKAKLQIREKEREREYIRKVYELRFSRRPAFHLVYDCSAFSVAQIAQHGVQAMKLRGLIGSAPGGTTPTE